MTTYVVSFGQTSNGITLNSGDTLTVSSGGTASSTTIDSGGLLAVASGGAAVLASIGGSGVLDLLVGAVVSGGITFGDTGGQLQIGGSAMPSSTISGFASGDTFDLTSI